MLIRNIKQLVQVRDENHGIIKGNALKELPSIENAFLWIEKGLIKDFGPMNQCPELNIETLDATDKMVFPAWCDSHTHLVFAGSREGEFVDRINGLSYEEIARKGGGILNSANRLRQADQKTLLEGSFQRLQEIQKQGTGAIEIKSGYGLNLEGELKMLRVIQELKQMTSMPIKATFLGAHALPLAYKKDRNAYIQLIIKEMLPAIAAEQLADYIDVFCEKGFYTPEETEKIIEAGAKYGLKAKIHTNQFNCLGGIEAAVKHQAVSVDHLEVVNDKEINSLLSSETIPTLLPSAPFFLNDHYPPARKIIDAGLPIALASDYNPGSTPSGKMAFVVSLACIKMKMLPEESINAATLNGAYAMEIENICGSITKGKQANFFMTKPIPSIAFLPYSFGSNLIDKVFLNGEA